jgi:hypothetical protein
MEMISLCRVFAILHFKICMPMRWLAGNTHSIGSVGYDWSARSMGKAIDALHEAMVEIKKDGSKFLDEDFMNDIFSKIYTDEDGNDVPLEPLVEAMKYQYEVKSTPAVDGSKVLPFDQLNAELFYPDRKENKATTETVTKMAVELANCFLKELRDPTKATSDYLSCVDGQFSWGQTTDEEHYACMGRMATNDPAESPFALLTRQMQGFGRLLGIHASAVGHARFNGDFTRDFENEDNNGAFLKLTPEMHDSLLTFALGLSPEVRKDEKVALDKQREAKKRRLQLLRDKKILAATQEYATALTYIDMYHSDACWKTATQARKQFSKLTSITAKKKAVKEQIKVRVVGFGWKDLHHAWSKQGVDYTPEFLRDYLIETIIPEQRKRGIPNAPTVNIPTRGDRNKLGTKSLDVQDLQERREKERQAIQDGGEGMRDNMEAEGTVDRYEQFQGPMPTVDETFVGAKIEQLWDFTEKGGTVVQQWCQGVVVAVKKNSKVHIEWDKSCVRDGDPKITQERLLKTKWNKHVEEAWRMNLE